MKNLKLLNTLTTLVTEGSELPKIGCTKFPSDSYESKLCKKINNRSYLSFFTPMINKIFETKKKKWSEVVSPEEQEKIFDSLELLKKADPNRRWMWTPTQFGTVRSYQIGTIDYFINKRLPELSFIYDLEDKPKWLSINKLDSNYSDIATLFTNIIKDSKSLSAEKIYKDLEKGNNSSLMDAINTIEEYGTLIFDRYLSKPDFYVQNIERNSAEGELIEDYVVDLMKENGWSLVHRGGGGDPIDYLLGVDIIMEKNGKVKTIQCKKVWDIEYRPSTRMQPEGSFRITGKPFLVKQRNIDFVGYGTNSKDVIVANKQQEVIKKDDKYVYTDKMVLPQAQGSSYFYIDKNSVIAKSKNL